MLLGHWSVRIAPPSPRIVVHTEKNIMYCQNCGSLVGDNVRFCQSCGKSQTPVPSPVVPSSNVAQVPRQYAPPKKQSKILWLVVGGIVLLVAIVGIIGKSPTDNSTSATQQSSAPNATPQPEGDEHKQQEHVIVKPPTYRVYKSTPEAATAYLVPVSTTDEELRNLLWFFRKKVRTGRFSDMGITKPTTIKWGNHNYSEGMLLVYRGAKCANESFVSEAELEKGGLGACGYGEHYDAYYQWGIDNDPAKDSGAIGSTEIFNSQDDWHPSSEVSLEVDNKVKETWGARQQEWEPRQRFAVQLSNEFLRKGIAVDVSANSEEPKELDFRSKLFSNATFFKTFTDTSVPKMRPDLCKAGFQNIRILPEGESDAGQSYPLHC